MGTPIVIAVVSQTEDSYRQVCAVLATSASLCLSSLVTTWRIYPRPSALDANPATDAIEATSLPPSFWLYLAAMSCIAIGCSSPLPIAPPHSATRQSRPP